MNPTELLRSARLSERNGDTEQAMLIYKKIITDSPESPEAKEASFDLDEISNADAILADKSMSTIDTDLIEGIMTETQISAINIGMCSGNSFRVSEVCLYDNNAVRTIASLQQKVSQLLSEVSTGLGFLGSPAWAIGGSLILGVLENSAQSSNQKKAAEILHQIHQLQGNMRETPKRIHVSTINNINIPNPSLWELAQSEMVTTNGLWSVVCARNNKRHIAHSRRQRFYYYLYRRRFNAFVAVVFCCRIQRHI
jgi:hypothetical protein